MDCLLASHSLDVRGANHCLSSMRLSTCWIGGGASCAPRQHAAVLDAALANDFVAARAAMDRLMPLMRCLEGGSYAQKVKRGCELLGIAVGSPRQPLLPLSEADRIEFDRIFQACK